MRLKPSGRPVSEQPGQRIAARSDRVAQGCPKWVRGEVLRDPLRQLSGGRDPHQGAGQPEQGLRVAEGVILALHQDGVGTLEQQWEVAGQRPAVEYLFQPSDDRLLGIVGGRRWCLDHGDRLFGQLGQPCGVEEPLLSFDIEGVAHSGARSECGELNEGRAQIVHGRQLKRPDRHDALRLTPRPIQPTDPNRLAGGVRGSTGGRRLRGIHRGPRSSSPDARMAPDFLTTNKSRPPTLGSSAPERALVGRRQQGTRYPIG